MNVDRAMDMFENPIARERFTLVVYLILMVLLVVPLTVMAGEAWELEGYSYMLIMGLVNRTGIGLQGFSVLLLGIFLGSILLMLIDPKKRWQGMLLGVGTVVGLLMLGYQDMFVTVIDFSANIHWMVIGILVGVAIGSLPILRKLDTPDAYEFRWATYLIFGILTVLVFFSYLEFHITYSVTEGFSNINTNSIILHTFSAPLFLYLLWRFTQYDANVDFFVVGPRQSGKSLLLIASFIQAKRRQQEKSKLSKTPLSPSSDLMKQLQELDNADEGWGIQATDIPRKLKFNYVHGKIFPTNMEVSTIDYPGEILPEIPSGLSSGEDSLIEAVTDGGKKETDGSTEYDYRYGSESDSETKSKSVSETGRRQKESGGERKDSNYETVKGRTVDLLTDEIRDADTLIFLIDSEKFLNSEDMGIEHYFGILRETGRKRVLLVATKCDYFVDEFIEEEDMFPEENFSQFKRYVNRRLQSNEQVNTLVLEAGGKDIHPVYYHTKETVDGVRVPIRDEAHDDEMDLDMSRTTLKEGVDIEESGNVQTVGFNRLLERLGE